MSFFAGVEPMPPVLHTYRVKLQALKLRVHGVRLMAVVGPVANKQTHQGKPGTRRPVSRMSAEGELSQRDHDRDKWQGASRGTEPLISWLKGPLCKK